MSYNKLVLQALFIFCISFGYTVENSVVPLVAKFENIENLSVKKYPRMQFEEISAALNRKQESVRVATFNMLFNLYDDDLPQENRWPERLPRIVEVLAEMQPDVIGVQELYPSQFNDLMAYLEKDYAFVSIPCDDGEMNGIFYRKARFDVVKSDVWYMSPKPRVRSSDTLTMLQFKDQLTGKVFAVFNTHLAFGNVEKRYFQVNFIGEQIDAVSQEMPVFLTGDMNTFPQRLDLEKLPFYDGDYVHRLLIKHDLHDSKEISLLGHVGPIATFTNSSEDAISFKGTGTPGIFLDHIYVSKGITVLIHAVQPGTVGGHFPSDHLPLFVDAIVD